MIGIVFIGDLIYCPYLRRYTNILETEKIEYEVLYWNREGHPNNYPPNYLAFNKESKLKRSPFFKIKDFIEYKIWLDKMILTKKYTKLIVLTTLTGILLSKQLLNKYKGNYIFDIRDYSYEHFKLFNYIEKKIIYNSFFTCISSEGFKHFLPKNYPYIIAHNFNQNELKNKKQFRKKEYGSTLNLVWLGSIRYFEHQIKIINSLKDDSRFNLIYHGTGPAYDSFVSYCEEYKEIKFTGKFDFEEKQILLNDADILNNSYGTRKVNEINHAMPNRYYDGIIYGIPQLVELNTFKHSKIKENGLGIGLDVNNRNIGDKLYDYYFQIIEDEFNSGCEKEIDNILKEDLEYNNLIKEFIYS